MALAYLTINLDAFTGDDHPPVPSYSTITLDPGADHIDAAADVIHVRTIVVSLDRQGKAATANGVPCVDGKVPVVAGVAYAVSAPNVLRGGPHYIPALTAGQVVDLSDYITPGAPLTPDQAAALAARVTALEAIPPGVTDHGALTGLGDDDHLHYLTTGRGDARYVQGTDPRLSDARTPTAHAASHASGGSDVITPASIGAATPAQVASGDSATLASAQAHAQGLVDALTAASPATLDTLAEIADALGDDPNFAATITAALANRVRFDAAQTLTVPQQAQARTNIGAGTSSFSGAYADLSGRPTVMTPTAHTHGIADLTATGTPSATTYLRGDGTWATPAGGGGGSGPLTGTGSPEGVVTATVGTEYLDTAATNGAVKWIKATGSGNTGWKVAYGDTGLRDITLLMTNGGLPCATGTGTLHARRVGDVVTFVTNGRMQFSATPSIAPMAGFTPMKTALTVWPWTSWDTTTVRALTYNGGWTHGSGPLWNNASQSMTHHTFLTNDAWPTTLPGTPA